MAISSTRHHCRGGRHSLLTPVLPSGQLPRGGPAPPRSRTLDWPACVVTVARVAGELLVRYGVLLAGRCARWRGQRQVSRWTAVQVTL